MRNFRKAALAGATAVAVAFGSTAVATAETNPSGTPAPEAPYTAPVREVTDKDSKEGVKPGSSHKITQSEWLEFRNKDGNLRGTDGKEIFGKDKDHFGEQPRYARLAYGATIFATISAVIGLIVGPLYNFIVHGPVKF